MAGFDCLWTDMEHVANDWSVIEKQILATKAYGSDLLVRVARGGYSDYTRPLELDDAGIMVPHIMSFEDAKKVVNMTRFHPFGRRPLDGGNADGVYCEIDILDYIKDANNEMRI
jgi:4-hydroxy-2-oxoheptanedioate aldolase